jgi:hypothetical protein
LDFTDFQVQAPKSWAQYPVGLFTELCNICGSFGNDSPQSTMPKNRIREPKKESVQEKRKKGT